MIYRNRLQRGESIERLETLFAAMAGFFHAAEWQLDAATSTIIIDEDLTGMDGMREAALSSAILGPDAADKAIGCTIGNRDGFFFRVERQDDLYGAKNFLLRQPMIGRHVADQRRQDIGPAFRRVFSQHTLRGNGETAFFRQIQIVL